MKRNNDGDKLKAKKRVQHFRQEWLVNEDFKYWLAPVPENAARARCTMCIGSNFVSQITVIRNHMKSISHKNNMKTKTKNIGSSRMLSQFVDSARINNTREKEIKTAEIKLCGIMTEHNFSFKTMDHLQDGLRNCFPDSELLKQISVKRTKATAITTNVIKDVF
jgi:hypothetical protein